VRTARRKDVNATRPRPGHHLDPRRNRDVLGRVLDCVNTITIPTVAFDTELGRCAVRWTEAAISGVLLPTAGGRPRPRLEDEAEVPPFVREAIHGMVAVMAGRAPDLRAVPVDERGLDAFRRAVYAATREIAPGSTRSYGEIARSIGHPGGARDVGAALARNPFPIVVPCHRVVAANGALIGFSAPGGLATKRRMLELEGVPGYGQQALFGDEPAVSQAAR
jgi:methylated-DNA-[protein]-cysteine S-methyltransferase